MPGEEALTPVDAAWGGVRLSLPLSVGGAMAEVELEPAHCERLFRAAAYAAVREGRLDPAAKVLARLAPGTVRERHGEVPCLDSCRVELLDVRGTVVSVTEFPRAVFAVFAVARALHLVAEGAAGKTGLDVAYSLHAVGGTDEEPFPVALPALPALSIAALRARAGVRGAPDDGWIATFVAPEVEAGLADMERSSRASGVEVAARIHARVGYDRVRRRFVRILERLVVSREVQATAVTVVSTAASWGDFLASGRTAGVQAPSSVHTHLHLPEMEAGGEGAPGDHLLAPSGAPPAPRATCISIHDILTHYTAFPDPLSAALIVSLFPDGRVVSLYGYTPRGQLREEPGWWALRAAGRGRTRAHTAEREDSTDAKGDHGV